MRDVRIACPLTAPYGCQKRRDKYEKNNPPLTQLAHADGPASEAAIAQLVGQVYAIAPSAERRRLLAHLLKPLGVLSIAAGTNGIFANIWFRSDSPEPHVRVEDAQNVQPGDVISLVNHVQQVSFHAVDGLADMLASSLVMTGSAAAVL